MSSHRWAVIPLAAFILLTSLLLLGEAGPSTPNIIKKDAVIAGGPKDSMEVRHLVLNGSNEEIGRTLALLAKDRYQAKLQPSQDRLRTRAQRRYIEKNYPILYDRMRGVASAYGQRLEDDAWNYSWLMVTELKASCSVFYLPPKFTTFGTGLVSRDYDFSTGSITFGFLPPGQLHATARPYLLELHPDRGYASLAMMAYDFLSGVMDGINSEGLTVTLAMDDELMTTGAAEPAGPAVGLGIQVLRLLLDTCGNATEAKETLLQTKQYYEFIPCHFLIADRFGNSFVWEYSHGHNKEHIIENPEKPLVMTNFTLSKRLNNGGPPTVAQAKAVCNRYCRLSEQLNAQSGKLSVDSIKAAHKKVDAELPAAAEPHRPPIRTLWHALYFPSERKMQISYYLGDETAPGRPDQVRIVRSEYQEFRLTPTETAKAPVPEAPVASDAVTFSGMPTPLDPAMQQLVDQLKAGGAGVRVQDNQVVTANLDKAADVASLLPLIGKMSHLSALSVRNAKLDDAGIAALKGLPKLALLNVYGSAITDEGLKTIATLPQLTQLNVGATKMTDAGLAHLAKLPRLEVLVLSDSTISDAGLAQLAGMSQMTGLFLSGTKVTDAGLLHLTRMPRLTKLNLAKTAVTDEGLAKAKKDLPTFIIIQR